MDIAVGATIAAVAKKVLALLLGDKKGRKFLLYVVGIALFIVSIPLITMLGLFGWMAGDSGFILDQDDILANIPNEQLVQMQTVEQVCNKIVTTFITPKLPAQGICIHPKNTPLANTPIITKRKV